MDTGATCHMCNDTSQFIQLQEPINPLTIILGDGGTLQPGGRGDMVLKVNLQVEELHYVLYVPDLECACSLPRGTR